MSVNEKTNEVLTITKELERLRLQMKVLNKRKSTLETDILQFITEQKQQGVKNRNAVFMKKEEEKLKAKTRGEKELILKTFFSELRLDEADVKAREFLKQKTPEDIDVLLRRYFYYLDEKDEKIEELVEKLKPSLVYETKLVVKKITK
jgi:hypothetical protein